MFDMTRIKDDRELKNGHAKGHGFVYNDFGDATGWNPENFNKLHKASCRWVRKMKTSTPKYFFETLNEALDWLHTHRPGRYSLCNSCQPLKS